MALALVAALAMPLLLSHLLLLLLHLLLVLVVLPVLLHG
jgi:hypothetical protein